MASKVYRYGGQTIQYTNASNQDVCVLCWEDIKKKQLQVKDQGKKAHFRCAYPEAYAQRQAWVNQNTRSNGLAPAAPKRSLKRVRRLG